MIESDNQKPEILTQDRFDTVRGKADIKWRTDDLMEVLRGDEICCLKEEACPGNSLDPGASEVTD